MYVLLSHFDPDSMPFQFPPLRKLNPAISAETEQVIHKAIQLIPEARFQSAAELWESIAMYYMPQVPDQHPDWPIWEDTIRANLLLHEFVSADVVRGVPKSLQDTLLERYYALHPDEKLIHSADFSAIGYQNFELVQATSKAWRRVKTPNGKCNTPLSGCDGAIG